MFQADKKQASGVPALALKGEHSKQYAVHHHNIIGLQFVVGCSPVSSVGLYLNSDVSLETRVAIKVRLPVLSDVEAADGRAS